MNILRFFPVLMALWALAPHAGEVQGPYLRECDLEDYPHFRHCDFYNADLSGLNLEGADFFKARLEDTNLAQANLSEANLHETDLTGANLHRARGLLTAKNLCSAIIDGDTTFPSPATRLVFFMRCYK